MEKKLIHVMIRKYCHGKIQEQGGKDLAHKFFFEINI